MPENDTPVIQENEEVCCPQCSVQSWVERLIEESDKDVGPFDGEADSVMIISNYGSFVAPYLYRTNPVEAIGILRAAIKQLESEIELL